MRGGSFDTDEDCSTSFQGIQSKTLALFSHPFHGFVSREKHPNVSSNGHKRNVGISTLGKPPGAEKWRGINDLIISTVLLRKALGSPSNGALQ